MNWFELTRGRICLTNFLICCFRLSCSVARELCNYLYVVHNISPNFSVWQKMLRLELNRFTVSHVFFLNLTAEKFESEIKQFSTLNRTHFISQINLLFTPMYRRFKVSVGPKQRLCYQLVQQRTDSNNSQFTLIPYPASIIVNFPLQFHQ
jgi:hypothetical protein